MKKNMGMIDRRVRMFVIAPLLVIVSLVIGISSVGGIILLVLAAVMVGTSAVGSCPLYLPAGIDTRTSDDK
jgi:hypothetical protein